MNFAPLILFLIGLSLGSFLNVVSLRFSSEERVFDFNRLKGRSHCLFCGKKLSWYELIPLLSFLIQRGKCRGCKKNISWQYPLVELVSALALAFTPAIVKSIFFFSNPDLSLWVFWSAVFIWGLFLLSLVLVFIIDLRRYIIPNSLNFFIFLLGIIWLFFGWRTGIFEGFSGGSFLGAFSSLFSISLNPVISHIVGSLIGLLFFFLIVILSKGRAMGMGDVKLIAGLGLIFGFPDIIPVILLSFIIGAAISVVLMVRKEKKMSDKIPFGPFLVVASFLVFFFGSGLMSLYFGIMGL